MVRPLIYNTPEEKKNAARLYRRTYYERKKEEISIKMAAKYRTKKIVSQVIDSGCQVSGAGSSKKKGAGPSKKKRTCIQRSSQAEKVVSQIMGSGEPSVTGPPTYVQQAPGRKLSSSVPSCQSSDDTCEHLALHIIVHPLHQEDTHRFRQSYRRPQLNHALFSRLTVNPVICGVDVAEASLLTCSIFNTLYAQMIRGPEDQQIVLAMLSDRLEILESIQEYVRSSHRGKSHLSAAITERLSNLFHRCKLVNAATEELWCYAAASGSFTPQLISINVCVSKQSLPTRPLPLRHIQEQFLLSRSDEFFAIRDPSQRMFFFSALFSRWFAHWPEEKVMFPGTPFHKLTPTQLGAVGVAVRKRRKMGNKWTTKDQRDFLETFSPEYREHMVDKNYEPLLKKVWRGFFERWPERSVILAHVPADQSLTKEQEELLKEAVSKRQAQITSWYRWQNNVSRLSRTSGTKGVLKFDTVLAGGVELSGTRAPKKMHIYSHEYYAKKVKIDADKAIHEDNITHRGPKLNMRLAITQEKFEAESDEVKEEVERKYRKAKAKFARARERLKGGKMPKVDTNTKVKAIRELGPMLDRVFRYLSHATGGWKFSVLMAGPDPTKGGTVVYDYHIGELGNGAQFNTFCDKFDGIQQAFLEFTNSALAFEATLPQDDGNNDSESDNSESDNEMNNISIKSVEDTTEAGSSGGVAASNINFHTDNLYRISPDLFNNESQELSALADNAHLGLLSHKDSLPVQQPQSTLPDDALPDDARLGFLLHQQQHTSPDHYSNLNFDFDPNVLALMAGGHDQIQLPPLGPFTQGSSITADGLNDDAQIQVLPSNPFTPSSAISELPLVLPPPPTPPQTPQVRLPPVPIEPIQDTDDAPVPSSPANRRRRAKAPAAQQQVQLQKDEPRQRRARNVAFNRRELDNAIGSNSGTKQKRGRGDDLGSNSNKKPKRG
ncbi:hypothetical protein C8R48DRAFT_771520 [Suillus tomentosus]|nr:hypothetical protein C8R48DRAFT_771520 [Suillus tomentosus]